MADSRTLYVILTGNASGLSRALKEGSRDVKDFERDVDGAGAGLDRFGKRADANGNSINQLTGRIRLILDALALIGPAAVPIGAIAIPAVAGLAAQLGLAAAAGGSAMLAFVGVGDAVKAVQEAAADPSLANLQKRTEALMKLTPQARNFVLTLHDAIPELDEIQDRASEELFEGLTRGLETSTQLVPRLTKTVGEYADVTGDVIAQLAEGLESKRGRDFLRFLEDEARPGVQNLYDTIANLAAGAAEMWKAFDPLNDDFSDWLLEQSERFDEWSQKLGDSEGFEDFSDYVRETGPQVAATLGEIADMSLQIVEAAAPLGGPVLKGLEGIANIIGTIADSPLGTPIFTALAAVTLLNRGLSITAPLLAKMGMTGLAAGAKQGPTAFFTSMGDGATKARGSIGMLRKDLGTIATWRGADMAKRQWTGYNDALTRTQKTLGRVAKGAGAVGAIGFVASGAADGLGVANTATLALAGAMVGGVPGAVAGGLVGAFMDVMATGKQVDEQIRTLEDTFNSSQSTIRDWATAAQSVDGDWRAKADDEGNVSGPLDLIGDAAGGLKTGLTGGESNSERLLGASKESIAKILEMDEALRSVNDELGGTAFGIGEIVTEGGMIQNTNYSLEDMERVLRHIQPALDALGYGMADLASPDVQERVVAWMKDLDSDAGRIDNVADAVAGLDGELITSADSAADLGTALESLIMPTLNSEAATDQWRQSLKDMRNELNDGAGFKGWKNSAMENREVTRAYATDAIARLTNLAGVTGTTQKDMARAVAETRREFIRSAIAGGIDADVAERRANALKLTPKLVRTVFRAAGIDKVERQARNLREDLRIIPKPIRMQIKDGSIQLTKAKVRQLVEDLDLTKKERRALVRIQDVEAKGKLEKLLTKLKDIDDEEPKPKVSAETTASMNALNAIQAKLSAINGTVAHTYVTTHQTAGSPGGREPEFAGGIHVGGRKAFAGGGWGQDGRYYDRVPQMVKGGANVLWGEQTTGWEAYISGHPAHRERNRAILGMAAQRLGIDRTPRGGSEYVTGGGGTTVVVQERLPDKVELVVDGHRMTAFVRGHAASVVAEHDEVGERSRGAHDRMRGWSDHG